MSNHNAWLRRERLRQFVHYYLSQSQCVDCGNDNIAALQFDHRNPLEKRADITQLVKNRVGLKTLLEEIHKCDIRCANCHSIKTAKDQEWYRRV